MAQGFVGAFFLSRHQKSPSDPVKSALMGTAGRISCPTAACIRLFTKGELGCVLEKGDAAHCFWVLEGPK